MYSREHLKTAEHIATALFNVTVLDVKNDEK